MALNDAIKFINQLKTDKPFRMGLYGCKDPQEMESYAMEKGFKFTYEESEDAYRTILLKAADHDEAYEINEIFNMYRMLLGMAPIEFNA